MMHISDPRHGDKRNVVQEPSDDGIQPGVVNLVNVGRLELLVASLPSNEVPGDNGDKDAETGRRAPVDDRIAEQKVLDDWKEKLVSGRTVASGKNEVGCSRGRDGVGLNWTELDWTG